VLIKRSASLDTAPSTALSNALSHPAQEITAWLLGHLASGARLTSDSRRVGAGDAFFAYPGYASDGRQYIEQALSRGAAAIVWEAENFVWPTKFLSRWPVPQRAVSGLRQQCGAIASAFFGAPSHAIELIAVTGTNGKTSITQWLAQACADLGRRSAVIGTLGAGEVRAIKSDLTNSVVDGKVQSSGLTSFGLTTPDALEFQAMLAQFKAEKIQTLFFEASSIGLEQSRLAASKVNTAVFTNLTRDHLDYHGTMQAYQAAKSQLFAWPSLRCAVLNADDPACVGMFEALLARLSQSTSKAESPLVECILFSVGRAAFKVKAALLESAVQAGVSENIRFKVLLTSSLAYTASGIKFGLDGDFGATTVTLELHGEFNVSNALAFAAVLFNQGYSFESVVAALERLRAVPGRMQQVPVVHQSLPLVVVDYAHTPDALEKALQALKALARARSGRLVCIFGAGGDRDPGKRSIMGKVAAQNADLIVVTSDNPRSESAARIIDDIVVGVGKEDCLIIVDRADAIAESIANAESADVILIAGKGHESYQEVLGVRHPFSDMTHASAGLALRRKTEANV
jgi:UDP-N-acetylmuramoyl-L-alanyl-D-glutamate--2,6-diaminopimelate ligase